jgi:hypothetical protein
VLPPELQLHVALDLLVSCWRGGGEEGGVGCSTAHKQRQAAVSHAATSCPRQASQRHITVGSHATHQVTHLERAADEVQGVLLVPVLHM